MTSMMMDYGARPEDVGEILVRVQEDLQSLREKLLVQGGGGREVDLSVIQEALDKTEEGIRQKTEQVVTQLNNRVLTLPSLEAQQARREEQQPYVSVETTWDLRANSRGNFGVRRTGMDRLGLLESRDMGRQVVPPAPPVPTTQMRKIPEKKLGQETMQMAGPTPGQMSKQLWTQRVLYNPYNPRNREVMSDSYGIQLPLIADRTSQKSLGNQVAKGSTVEPLAVLPRANRVDPQLVPPAITEDDAQKGILSLIERGLIPPAADLTLDPNPVRHKVAPLHNPKEKDKSQAQPASNEGTFNLASVRFDPSTKPGDGEHPAASTKLPSPSPDVAVKSRISSGRVGSAQKVAKTPLAVKTVEMPLHPLPPPTTPASGDFKDRHHRFAIQHGKVRDLSQEFLAFKQHYCLSWGSIVTMLKHLEKMLVSYAVPIAFIHGDKLADLSLEFELEKAPSVDDMLSVIVNREDVESIIRRPGRRFIGPNGEDLAAAKIQATFKAYCERLRYLDYRRRKWAAGVIAISWVMNVKMAKVRKQLVTTRKDQLEAFRIRAKTFAKSWDRIQSSKRVIIHIPSLGHSQHIRNTIDDFGIRQNMQMARLCDTRDPNVDVIYVSPVSVNDETFQYYTKLLGLKAAIESGNVEDQAEVTDRYKIITPEGTKSFPTHHMCLSTHLKYSPRAIKRIKNLIRGREAYIVTGHPHVDDLSVASELDVPILCPEPEVAHLYSTKSGSKRIFASACVEVPPGEFDVYSLPQLHECLAQLVTENLDVRRWLFKLDDEFDGRGIAYCDIADHMRCYPWALKEAQRYGEKWSKKWAQEAAYIKIHAEIPDVLVKHATPVNTTVYKNWDKFLQAFLSQGGVIEACPPSDSVTNLTANMLIEPNGRISLVSMGDQIHALSQFQCWGMSVPQSSVEPDQLNDVCFRVAEACKARGVVGYFAIDLVTFIESKTMEQKLWATDLNLSYDDSLAMFHLMQYVTHGTLDMKTHFFDIPIPKREEKKSRRRRQQEDEVAPNTNRYAVMSTHLRHTNLSVVHYSVFFQMCRAHGIGYDIKEKQGTVFTLIDSFNRENLGMLTVGDNLQGALATFARNLSVIHQEISAPNMQGHSNFQPVISDISDILGYDMKHKFPDGEIKSVLVDDLEELAVKGKANLLKHALTSKVPVEAVKAFKNIEDLTFVIDDIESILGTTIQNAEEQEEEVQDVE